MCKPKILDLSVTILFIYRSKETWKNNINYLRKRRLPYGVYRRFPGCGRPLQAIIIIKVILAGRERIQIVVSKSLMSLWVMILQRPYSYKSKRVAISLLIMEPIRQISL